MSDREDGSSPKEISGNHKPLTPREQHFAKLMHDSGLGGVEAARIAFGWRCEPDSAENQKARDLARSPRLKAHMATLQGQRNKEQEALIDFKLEFGDLNRNKLRDYAFKQLTTLRDNPHAKAAVRYNAIKILKKLHDPGKDVNLIWKWMDVAWRYQSAHCPCCHRSFPLAVVENKRLSEWRERNDQEPLKKILPDRFTRLNELIKRADRRRVPHKSQVEALSAPERHILGLGAARGGKSYLLALFAVLGICLPGVEIWIIGETYERSHKEVEYIKRFLNAIFYPHFNSLISVNEDKKTGELLMTTKWGSSIRVKSAKSKGSITAVALEFALAAEPGWMPADIYNNLRARMSERLGRIIALGTPQGIGAFVGRMANPFGRDPDTGKLTRWKPDERLIKNGCDWEFSLLKLQLDPSDNPEYVKSELGTARMELSDEEYATEFEGIGVQAEGMKFSSVMDHHAQAVGRTFFDRATFVLGVDQGPKNFGAILTAYDGERVVPCWEYYNSDITTMKRNLVRLRARVPLWIAKLGGNTENWALTITDIDPPLYGAFEELEEESLEWPTEVVMRHRNVSSMGDNWRRELQEFVNGMARRNRLIFHMYDEQSLVDDESPGAYILHDQVQQTVDKPDDPDKESRGGSDKGWMVADPMRGDHCFHPDTEVLTANGWMKVAAINVGDTVMSRSPDGEIEWVGVTNTIAKDYDGNLYSYGSKTDGAKFLVTPDHMLYVQDQRDNLQFVKVKDIVSGNAFKFYKSPARSIANVLGSGLPDFYGFKDGNSFAYFLGFFLAEGCTSLTRNRKYVHLDQKNRSILDKILSTRALPAGSIYRASNGIHRLSFRDDVLYDCISGDRADTKYIPRWFFNSANKQEHEQMYAGLMDGDGTWAQRKYDSTSEELIDNFQELVSRLGVVSTKVMTTGHRESIILGRKSKCKPVYRVRHRDLLKQKSTLTLREHKFKPVPYVGKVYCVSAPPNNVLFTRYKGKTMWIGQCLDAWYFTMWTVFSNQLKVAEYYGKVTNSDDPWAREKAAFAYKLERQEQKELKGFIDKRTPDESFESKFGFKRKPTRRGGGFSGHYGNEA